MAKYRAIARKIIEAEQWTDFDHPPPGVYMRGVYHVVKTIQGQEVPVSVGEWIVKESGGPGYYPIEEAEFDRLYEPAPRD